MKKALYRAFRPTTFDEVLGQDAIVRVLKNQIRTGQPGHAYLFAGTRGTGKTSCAKIFSRAVNCLHPHDGNPCNECENCRAILEETTLDVVEMDAASNRRIDDIRELKEHVIYPPSKLKYKVYIIDEAHMITREAFNALLKIMEEPPAHLIFILATTNPDQIPDTILSRLQRYEFKRLDPSAIEQNILHIAGALHLEVEPAALHAMTLSADGAMRDALSLMDQVLAEGAPVIREETVRKILGTVGPETLHQLATLALSDNLPGLLSFSQQIIKSGKDPQNLIKELIDYFRLLLLVKGLGQTDSLPIAPAQAAAMAALVKDQPLDRLVDSLELLLAGEDRLRRSDFSEAILQATLVKLVNYVDEKSILSRLALVEAKLKTIERWQIPEHLVRNEVLHYLEEVDPSTFFAGLAAKGAVAGDAPAKEGAAKATAAPAKEAPAKTVVAEDAPAKAVVAEDASAGLPSSDGVAKAAAAVPMAGPVAKPAAHPEAKSAAQPVTEPAAENVAEPVVEAPKKNGPQPLIARDSDRWLTENAGLLRQKVEERHIVQAFLFMKYQGLVCLGYDLLLVYNDPLIAGVVQASEREIAEIFQELLGPAYHLRISTDNYAQLKEKERQWRAQDSSSPGNAMPSDHPAPSAAPVPAQPSSSHAKRATDHADAPPAPPSWAAEDASDAAPYLEPDFPAAPSLPETPSDEAPPAPATDVGSPAKAASKPHTDSAAPADEAPPTPATDAGSPAKAASEPHTDSAAGVQAFEPQDEPDPLEKIRAAIPANLLEIR